MSESLKPKMSLSEEMFSSFALRNKTVTSSHVDSDPGTSYEVFRNNTTAIEVIVKEVPKNKKKSPPSPAEFQDVSIVKRLQDDIDRLRTELNIAKSSLMRSRRGFLAMVREMKNQLDTSNQREVETQTKNLTLQLDNEKLKSLLISRTNLLNKLKRELNGMKRVMRYVIKSICYAPQVVSENLTCSSDPEYDDFENDLKKNVKVKFASNMFEDMATFDSSISKDTKHSFDKRVL